MKIQHIQLQQGDGRNVRQVLTAHDIYANDPFIILADDTFTHNTFADHPHKGMQTVTYVLEGSLEHYDSQTGGGGRLSEGDFQIMTAGKGIVHNENPDRGEEVRVLQLWVNLSSEHKKEVGNYQDLAKERVPRVDFDGGYVDVLAGTMHDVTSPLALLTPFIYSNVVMQAQAQYTLPIPAHYNSYLYVLEGELSLNDNAVQAYDFIHVEPHDSLQTLNIEASTNTRFVFFSGEPIKEPIVAQGPFVMNTAEEIQEAFQSYRAGTFLDGKAY